MFGYMNWYAMDGYREFLFYVPFQQLLLIGPVFYAYIKSLLYPLNKLEKSFYLHFIPACIYLLYSTVAFIWDVFIFDVAFFYADGKDKDLLPWYQLAGLFSMSVYTALGLVTYLTYRKQIVNAVSYADSVAFRWMQHVLSALIIMLVARAIFILLYPSFGSFGSMYWYYLIFATLVYFLTIQGYAHLVTVFTISKANKVEIAAESNKSTHEARSYVNLSQSDHLNHDTSYDAKALAQKRAQLSALFEQQHVYRDPELSLQGLASMLNWHTKETSAVINQGFEKNFNDFVNTYRVNEFKQIIVHQEGNSPRVLDSAFECGFNSKSTFNRVFKRLSGQTPKQFIEDSKK